MKFRIYYKDGTHYDGDGTEDAMNAPTMGAIVVKQEAPNTVEGFHLRCSAFFCWEKATSWTDENGSTYGSPERWGGKDDQFGLSRYWATEKGAQKVLQGEEVDCYLFQNTKGRAIDDGYLDKRRVG